MRETGGELNLGFTPQDDPKIVSANRRLFLKALSGDPRLELITLRQIHSSLVRAIDSPVSLRPFRSGKVPAQSNGGPAKNDLLFRPPKGDGAISSIPGVLLSIQTADCFPVLLVDRKKRIVAAFHAGWRGTVARIVEHGVGSMRLLFGSKLEDLTAAIGPGIGQCCYAVGEEVQQEFESQFSYSSALFREFSGSDVIREKYPMLFLTARAPGHSNLGPRVHLDLAEANRRQLLSAGLREDSIYQLNECTSCHTDKFFSHRAEKGFAGRMMAVIGINASAK